MHAPQEHQITRWADISTGQQWIVSGKKVVVADRKSGALARLFRWIKGESTSLAAAFDVIKGQVGDSELSLEQWIQYRSVVQEKYDRWQQRHASGLFHALFGHRVETAYHDLAATIDGKLNEKAGKELSNHWIAETAIPQENGGPSAKDLFIKLYLDVSGNTREPALAALLVQEFKEIHNGCQQDEQATPTIEKAQGAWLLAHSNAVEARVGEFKRELDAAREQIEQLKQDSLNANREATEQGQYVERLEGQVVAQREELYRKFAQEVAELQQQNEALLQQLDAAILVHARKTLAEEDAAQLPTTFTHEARLQYLQMLPQLLQ